MNPAQPSIEVQRSFWNEWNASTREKSLGEVPLQQAKVILDWLESIERKDLTIIDIGCGAGWLCEHLMPFGRVTATDLSDDVLMRAAQRSPEVRFVAGDFMALDFGIATYDVAICLEMLSHVSDQKAFLQKISMLLRPGGYLMLSTQNKPALIRNNIPATKPGQLRKWVDRKELRQFLTANFAIERLFSITPRFNRGFLGLLNSHRLARLAERVRLGIIMRMIKILEERLWLGWSLMVLARKNSWQ